MKISRRLFLGGLVTTAAGAKPMLETFTRDLDLQVDRALDLQEGDVLVVRVPASTCPKQFQYIREELTRSGWPEVVVVSAEVEFGVVRRAARDQIPRWP